MYLAVSNPFSVVNESVLTLGTPWTPRNKIKMYVLNLFSYKMIFGL